MSTAPIAISEAHSPSLEGFHGTIPVPARDAGFWKNYRAFVGPALLVSVGYMDPGNWATDLEAGARYKFGLLWVVAASSFMAIVLQILSARLGIVTGKDLAQACRDFYPAWTRLPNWLFCELAICACDLAEVLGSAIALNLLFDIPIFWAVLITALDVLVLLALQGLGMRFLEAIILVLVGTIGLCYFVEIFVLPQTKPDFVEMGEALIRPGFPMAGMIPVAIGILGATVMPHNLYLHSALVRSRQIGSDADSIGRAIRFNVLDTVIALSIAFFINAAILVLATVAFEGPHAVSADGSRRGRAMDHGRLQDAAAAQCPRGQRPVRAGPSGERAEQHDHRHPGGSGRDGRLHALAGPAVGASHRHPGRGDHSRDRDHRPPRRSQSQRLAGADADRAGAAVAVRDGAAAALHVVAPADGRV